MASSSPPRPVGSKELQEESTPAQVTWLSHTYNCRTAMAVECRHQLPSDFRKSTEKPFPQVSTLHPTRCNGHIARPMGLAMAKTNTGCCQQQ